MAFIDQEEYGGMYLNGQAFCEGWLNGELVLWCEDSNDGGGDPVDPENQPASIGDIVLTTEAGKVTVLNLDTFRNLAAPPYSDPENDLIDAVRFDKISPYNGGTFYINNKVAKEGDIITDVMLANNEVIHIASEGKSYETDRLSFSIRDKGSKKWVQ